jgi:hypothetical protein
MSYPKPIGYRDYNFFKKLEISATDFQDDQDAFITFANYGLILTNEDPGTEVVEYSFNGETVHGELIPGNNSPTRQMVFLNRQISRIWFRVKDGSMGPIIVRIDAW